MIELREFRPGDAPALRAVFESAIHGVAIRHYTPQQVDAWAPREHDAADWAEHMQDLAPFVAERDGEIVAYADVQPDGYIDHFFVSAAAGGQGVGGALMRRLMARADELGLSELTSNVSLTAQPFFAHFGFEIVEHRVVDMDGVELRNAAMRKALKHSPTDDQKRSTHGQ
jgi:putative acetyltransferase